MGGGGGGGIGASVKFGINSAVLRSRVCHDSSKDKVRF